MRHTEDNLRKMLNTLLESDSFVTLEQLSCELDISKRSVQNYMIKAELWLRDHDLTDVRIVKKQGYGILLKTNEPNRQKLSALLGSQYFTLTDGSVERRIEILRSLVFSKDELTIQFLADQFYVSRFVILSDLDWVENWLSQYELKLFKTQHRGIGIVGSEVARRAAIAGFFDLRESGEPSVAYQTNQAVRLAKERLQKLEEVYKEEDIQKVCAIIEEAEKEFDFFMGSEFFTALATHITISVFRLRHGCQIKKEFLPPDGEFPKLEMSTAYFIAKRLEKTFEIRFPESEKTYICIHLMGCNAFQELSDRENHVPENIETLTLHLIEAVEADVGVNFTSDKMLFFGLLYHLGSAIYLLKENPNSRQQKELSQFSESYQEIYDSVKKHSELYYEFGGVKPDKREIVCITLHFALSLDRTMQKKRVLLVSNAGVLTLQKLRRELQENITQINIVDACSSNQFALCPVGKYDFIISTLPLENAARPVVNVAHLNREEQIQAIEEFIFSKLDNEG